MQTALSRRILHIFAALFSILFLAAAGLGIVFYLRIHAYDEVIAKAGQAYATDTGLIRAVIWKESHFNRRHVGRHGEIGLMQVTEAAAREWAEATGQRGFAKQDLFQPEINIFAGTWYLQRAIRFWSAKPNPLPYALAEYNAGRSNTQRWAAQDRNDPNVFWTGITYPTTRRYVRDILCSYRREK